jgi:hypothetical protein
VIVMHSVIEQLLLDEALIILAGGEGAEALMERARGDRAAPLVLPRLTDHPEP